MASTANQHALTQNEFFRRRVEMKLIRHAMWVLDNDPPLSATEIDIAKSILGMGQTGYVTSTVEAYAQRLVRMIASAPAFSDKVTEDVSGSTITDLNLETAVSTYFARMK